MNFEKISPLNDHDEIKKARKEKKLAEKKSTEDKVKKDDETNKLTRRKLIKIGLGAFVGSLIPEGIERLKNNEKNIQNWGQLESLMFITSYSAGNY